MASSIRPGPSSRYSNNKASSYDSSTRSSTKSDPSSSTDRFPTSSSSRALARTTTNKTNNFSSMVKKFVETKTHSSKKLNGTTTNMKLVIPADFIAQDLKKNGSIPGVKKGSALKKLFGTNSSKKREEDNKKALTEVKVNTRTLAMVLRSERELLSLNKEQENKIAELNLLVEEKNREVEKLKDLCLKQREEIKSLKSAILFPDVMNSQLQGILEQQGSELKQARQLIPSLQRQVTSLTGQLQCLAEDLAEVKADKQCAKGFYDNHANSPRTLIYDQEEAANSLEFSSGDHTMPGSPDDMLLKDLNPCLTPYAKSKSKESNVYDSFDDESLSGYNTPESYGFDLNPSGKKLSKSSDCCQCSKRTTPVYAPRRSDERKYGKQTHHSLF